MCHKFLILALTALTVFFAGCATSFRAGGRNTGMEAGAVVGPAPAPVVVTEPPVVPPPVK